MFWHASVLPSICLSTGGYPYPTMLCNISQNAMGQTLGGTLPGPAGVGTLLGGTLLGSTLLGGIPCWGEYPDRVPPGQDGGYPGRVPAQQGTPLARSGQGGYPVKTTEGVVTTCQAVCLLRSHRRTFLLFSCLTWLMEDWSSKINAFKKNMYVPLLNDIYRPHPKDEREVMVSVCSHWWGGGVPQGTYPPI